MKQGKVAEACDAFEASNRIESRAGTLIRLGECREQNHQLASAWSAYKDALTRVKDARKRAIATSRVSQLEGKLSYLTVTVSDDSRVDGLTLTRNGQAFDQALWNRAVPVNGGDFVIAAQAPGHDGWKATVRVPGESGKVSIAVPKLKVPPVADQPVAPPAMPEPGPVVDGAKPRPMIDVSGAAPDEPSMWTTRRKIAIGGGVIAVLGVGAGIVMGAQAKAKQDDAHDLCPDPARPCAGAARAQDLIKQGQNRALIANISYGVAVTAVIVAGVLWFTGAPERPLRVSIVPSIDAGAAALNVLGRF
jgi:hypothetical protein